MSIALFAPSLALETGKSLIFEIFKIFIYLLINFEVLVIKYLKAVRAFVLLNLSFRITIVDGNCGHRFSWNLLHFFCKCTVATSSTYM